MRNLLFTLFILFGITSLAQNKTELGFNLSQFQGDFGYGLHLNQSLDKGNHLAIKLKFDQMFLEHLDPKEFEYTWTPFQTISLGLISSRFKIAENVGLYGEGGVVGIIPNKDFSSTDFEFGGYGLFGFEFYYSPAFCYYFEAGGLGSSATADKLSTKDIYANGFILSVGLRIGFGKNKGESQ